MNRTWTADQTNPDVIRLLCNGVHLASVVRKDDYGGCGWQVNPMSPNHPRSRKYWPTAKAAVKQYGVLAQKVVADVTTSAVNSPDHQRFMASVNS